MSTTVQNISGDLPAPPDLLKSLNLLKSHASKVSNFTLQWQDLEDHLRSIDASIQSRINQLLQSNQTQLDSEPNSVQTRPDRPGADESSFEGLNFNGVMVRDGEALLVYMNEHLNLNEKQSSRDFVANLVSASVGCGKIVLEAMRWFYPSEEWELRFELTELSAVRRSCVVLLEEMTRVRPLVGDDVREEAARLAVEWKGETRNEVVNSLEVWAFLQLVGGFGLVGEFDRDEIFDMIVSVAVRKQAPELFRSLGFADRASEFIQKLVSQKMRLEAIKFIHAFELLDKFPPMPLLKAHLNFSKKDAKISCKRGKYPLKAEDAALDKEAVSLRAIIRCIENYKLEVEPQLSPENLRKRISQLEQQKKEKRSPQVTRVIEAQGKHLSGRKRTAPDKNSNKHHTADSAVVRIASFRAPTTGHSIHPSILHSVDLIQSRGSEYFTPSTGMPQQGADAPHTSYGTTSTFNSLRVSHYKPTGSYKGAGADMLLDTTIRLTPFLMVMLAYQLGILVWSSPITHTRQTTLTGGAFELPGDSPITRTQHTTQHMNSTTASYGLGGSTSVTSQLSPLTKRYGASTMSVTPVSGRSGKFGSAGSPSPACLTNASPNSYVSSNSGYGHSNQYQPSIYHL